MPCFHHFKHFEVGGTPLPLRNREFGLVRCSGDEVLPRRLRPDVVYRGAPTIGRDLDLCSAGFYSGRFFQGLQPQRFELI